MDDVMALTENQHAKEDNTCREIPKSNKPPQDSWAQTDRLSDRRLPAALLVGPAGKEYKAEVGLLTRGILFTSDATSTATGIGESYV